MIIPLVIHMDAWMISLVMANDDDGGVGNKHLISQLLQWTLFLPIFYFVLIIQMLGWSILKDKIATVYEII